MHFYFVLLPEPQGYDPKITFGKAEYQVGEILEANCTTSPARPPPHITWFINKQKVSLSFHFFCFFFIKYIFIMK